MQELKMIQDKNSNKWKPITYRLLSIPISIFMILIVYFFNIPNPMMILIILVVLFSYLDGYISGLLSGCTTVTYSTYYFCIVTVDEAAGIKLMIIVLAISSIIILVGKLKAHDIRTIAQLKQTHDELIEAKEHAEELSRTKSDFLSRMSHEIRTPLNAVIGLTGIALKNKDGEKTLEYLEKINDASVHLLGIINDILDMSKIEIGKFELSISDFVLEQMLSRVVNVCQLRFDQKTQDFTIVVDPGVPTAIITDQQRLAQVITNLLSNAAKFTPDRGKITLSIRLQDEKEDMVTIRFEVKDEGIGITEEQMSRLFRSFEQADSSISSRFGGTGLGLSISKTIVEMMDGAIWAESTPGQGSCFIFDIRVKKGFASLSTILNPDNECLDDQVKPLEQFASNTDPDKDIFLDRRMLLVEDVEINREIIKALVEETGIDVVEAQNGLIACNMFEQAPREYDIVLMDVHMPEMDGYTASRKIRGMKHLAEAATIPILALTANVFREDIEQCLAAGMNDHVGKPVEAKELLHKMKQLIFSK